MKTRRNILNGKFKLCGHEVTEENVIVLKTGGLSCKACRKENVNRSNERAKKQRRLQGAMN